MVGEKGWREHGVTVLVGRDGMGRARMGRVQGCSPREMWTPMAGQRDLQRALL